MQTDAFHIQVLNEEFSKRCQKNSRYSMRAFAKHLEMHPSALSRILSGKQKISSASAIVVAKKIGLCRERSRLFLHSIIEEHKKLESEEAAKALEIPELKVQPYKIDEHHYAIIARLISLATRELMLTENFISQPEWIAQRLGATKEEVEECLKTLVHVGLAEQTPSGYAPKERHLTAVNTKESNATRMRLQKEIVQRALDSLEHDPFHRRSHYGMTMSVNPDQIETANKMILEFMETLCDHLENGSRKEVYQLAVQLFPLTKNSSQGENQQ